MSRQAPSILHLFFADNYIIFCRATMEECKHVASVLDIYEKESGQKHNREKTLLFFFFFFFSARIRKKIFKNL